jgi:hypothetical protein
MPALLALCLALVPVASRGQEVGAPHAMTKSDGSLDMEACGACHNEDLSLQRSKVETCTLCHAQTVHAGSDEHLRASAAAVKEGMASQPKGGAAFPLTDDGQIFCGTCHLFHDPKVMSEDWLVKGWLPPEGGFSGAVRQAVVDRWAALAAKSEDKAAIGQFVTKGTRLLRMPVDQGQLCAQCHGALR